MPEIVVKTEILRASASELERSASSILQAGSEASSASAVVSASEYEGQLAAKVSTLVAEARGTSDRLAQNANGLEGELIFRADGFDAANEAGASAMLRPSAALQQIGSGSTSVGLFAKLRQLGVDRANAIWGMAGFTGGLSFGALITTLAGPNTLKFLLKADQAREFVEAGLLSQSLKQGTSFLGQTKVYGIDIPILGREWSKQWILGLNSQKLTSISEERLVAETISDKVALTKWNVVSNVAMLGARWAIDVDDYHATTVEEKMGILVVDSSQTVLSLGASIAGTVVAGPIGSVAGPWAIDHVLKSPITIVLPEIGRATGRTLFPSVPFVGPALGQRVGEVQAAWLLGPQCTEISFKDASVYGWTEIIRGGGQLLVNGGERMRNYTHIDRIFEKGVETIQMSRLPY